MRHGPVRRKAKFRGHKSATSRSRFGNEKWDVKDDCLVITLAAHLSNMSDLVVVSRAGVSKAFKFRVSPGNNGEIEIENPASLFAWNINE